MNKIYTGKGDTGNTSLANGSRVSKSHPRIAAYGKTDELIAWVGYLRSHPDFSSIEALKELGLFLKTVQNDLMHLAAKLASVKREDRHEHDFIKAVHSLEESIDSMQADLPPLHSFILPGSPSLASVIHIVRTVCRETERLTVALGTDGTKAVDISLLTYLNRLSDFFFTLARFVTIATGCKEDFFV